MLHLLITNNNINNIIMCSAHCSLNNYIISIVVLTKFTSIYYLKYITLYDTYLKYNPYKYDMLYRPHIIYYTILLLSYLFNILF